MSGENFYLSELDTTVVSTLATLRVADTNEFSGDATAEVSVLVDTLQNLFQFESDSTDITNADNVDIKFKVVYTSSDPKEPLGIDLNTNTAVTANTISPTGDQHLAFDWVRHLAKELFGIHLGADLFLNEEELRTALDTDFKEGFDTKLAELDLLESRDATHTDNNPSKKLLDQISSKVPDRLGDIARYRVSQDDNWFKMPILEGDKLFFRLTINPHANETKYSDRTTAPASRVYLIKINAVDTL